MPDLKTKSIQSVNFSRESFGTILDLISNFFNKAELQPKIYNMWDNEPKVYNDQDFESKFYVSELESKIYEVSSSNSTCSQCRNVTYFEPEIYASAVESKVLQYVAI